MADHEIPLLDSRAGGDISHRGAVHGHDADIITSPSQIWKRRGEVPWVKGGDQDMKYLLWILAAVGSWLIAAPFLLGYASTAIAKNNDASVGVVMVLGALIWGFSEWRHHRLSTDLSTQHR